MRPLTSQEILDKCPEEIPAESIRLKKTPGPKPFKGGGINRKAKWWSEDDRIKAATVYAMTGNASRVEEITGVPAGTIRQWKTQEWWPQIIDRIRYEKDDELDVKFTGIIDKAVDLVNDRLENGDIVLDVNTGKTYKRQIPGREAAGIVATFIDRRTALRDQVGRKADEAGILDRLKKLASEFEKFTKSKTIEGEVVRDIADSPDN